MKFVNSGLANLPDGFTDSLPLAALEEIVDMLDKLTGVMANHIGRIIKELLPKTSYTKWEPSVEQFVTWEVGPEGPGQWRKELGSGDTISDSVLDAWMNYSKREGL